MSLLSGIFSNNVLSDVSLDLLAEGPAGFTDSFDSFVFQDIGYNITNNMYFDAASEIMAGAGSLGDRLYEVQDLFGSQPHVDMEDAGAEIRFAVPGTGSEWVYRIDDTGSGSMIVPPDAVLRHYVEEGTWELV